MSYVPHITVTMIFKGNALNRDQKIGGNILSIKKLQIDGKTYSFISKNAIRHYLFRTLLYSDYKWKPAKVNCESDVVQFDLTECNIINCEELDVFGYMFTGKMIEKPSRRSKQKEENEESNEEKDRQKESKEKDKDILTRKSPLGITKAISIFPYEGDILFYSNHDLVERSRSQGIQAYPNIYIKEEHNSFYKVSFTFDVANLGRDTWIFNKSIQHRIENINDLFQKIPVFQKMKNSIKDIDVLVTLKRDNTNDKPEEAILKQGEIIPIDKYSGDTNKLDRIDFIIDEKTDKKDESIIKFVKFVVSKEKKLQRILQILSCIRNGFISSASNEDNTIIPVFLVAAFVKVPCPIFHPYINLRWDSTSEKYILYGIDDALNNGWVYPNQHAYYYNFANLIDIQRQKNSQNNSLKKWEDLEGDLRSNFDSIPD